MYGTVRYEAIRRGLPDVVLCGLRGIVKRVENRQLGDVMLDDRVVFYNPWHHLVQ